VTGFAETGGDDDHVLDAAAAALLDDVRNGLRARGDDRQLDAGTDFLDRLIGRDALDGRVLGIDRIERPRVAGLQDVPEEDVADRVFAIRSADDGDRFGLKKTGEIVLFVHGSPPCY